MFKKIAVYTAGLYLTTLFAAFVRVFLRSVIAKFVSKEALGVFTYFTSAQLVAISFLAFGLNRTLAKHVAASAKDDKNYSQVVSAVLAILLGASVILTLMALVLYPYLDWVWIGIMIGAGPVTLFAVAQSTLRGQFDRNREMFAAFFNTSMQCLMVTLFVVIFATSESPVMGLIFSNILVTAVIVTYFIRRDPLTWRFSNLVACYKSTEFQNLMLLAAPLWLTDILAVLGRQVDTFIVERQLGYVPLAEYGVAFTFIGVLNQPLIVMSRMFLVTFASGLYTDLKQYERVSAINLAFISTIGLAVTVLSIPLTPIIFTNEYPLAPTLAVILSVSFIFKAVEVFNTSMTIAHDDPHSNLMAKVWTFVLYVPLAFFLVAKFGVIGAALSNVFSESGYALIHAFYMRRHFPDHAAHTFRQCFVGTLLYLTIVGSLWVLGTHWLVLIAAVPIYLGLGHLLHLWNLHEIPFLVRRLLSKSKKKGEQ